MEVTATCQDRILELYLKGELDHHGAKGLLTKLEREIEASLPSELVLNIPRQTPVQPWPVSRKPSPPTFEMAAFAQQVQSFAGNRKALARQLGCSERTLYRRLTELEAWQKSQV